MDSQISELDWGKIGRLEPYKNRIEKVWNDFKKAFQRSLTDRGTFTRAFALSVAIKGADLAKFFLLFRALGFEISVVEIIIMMGVYTLLLSIPSTPGSLGVVEGGLTSVLVFLGIPAPTAATVVFIDRLLSFWGITAIGGMLGVHYGVNILESGRLKE